MWCRLQAVYRPWDTKNRSERARTHETVHAAQERFSRDVTKSAVSGRKILDIFEGTQQIQQLIVARRVLGKTSAELK